MLYGCKAILDIMKKNEFMTYYVNGKLLTLYEMMLMFDQSKPAHIEYYKGFGEMSGEKLQESTVGIDNRSLIRYTMEDFQKEYDMIRYYESNRNELISGIKVTRFDLI